MGLKNISFNIQTVDDFEYNRQIDVQIRTDDKVYFYKQIFPYDAFKSDLRGIMEMITTMLKEEINKTKIKRRFTLREMEDYLEQNLNEEDLTKENYVYSID